VTFDIVSFDPKLDRGRFKSGSIALDQYLQQQVSQDIRRRVSACFLALDSSRQIAAYYTLASASVLLDQLPAAIQKKLPRYAAVPAVRMGRLALAEQYQLQGLGSALLADALARSCGSEITAFALIVDAKDSKAAHFYLRHGFISLSSQPLALFLPLASAANLVNKKRSGSEWR